MPCNAGTPSRKAGIFIIAALIQPPPADPGAAVFDWGGAAGGNGAASGQGMGKKGGVRAPRPTVYGEAKDSPEPSRGRSGPGCVF